MMSDVVKLFFNKPLFSFFCLLLVFENTVLNSLGGALTSNVAFFLLPLVFFFECILSRGKCFSNFIVLVFFVFSFSVLMLLLFVNKYDLTFIIDRGGRQLLLFIVFSFIFFYCKSLGLYNLSVGAKIFFFTSLVSLVINIINPSFISSHSFFHYNDYASSSRFRGFSSEASNFGFQIVICTLLFGVTIRKFQNLFFLIAIIFALLSTSKGAAIMIVISFSIVFLSKKINLLKVLVSLFFLVVLFFMLINFVLPDIYMDLEKFTSIATRGTMILISIFNLFNYPTGVGFFGYLPSIYENGPKVVSFIMALSPLQLNFSEVNEYFVVGNFENIGTKSFIFDMMLWFGFVFLIPFFVWVVRVYKTFIRAKEILCAVLFVFFILSLFTYISNFSCYLIPYFFAFFFLKQKEILLLNKTITFQRSEYLKNLS